MGTMYICPMHPEVTSSEKGRCSKCGMELVLKSKSQVPDAISKKSNHFLAYKSLYIIILLIFVSSIFISFREFSINSVIENFMIGFFLVFAGFKLLDLKGFAQGYSTYDLLAKRWHAYGYIYPFIELFFAFSMILNFYLEQILIIEVLFMIFSGMGVLYKLVKKESFQCVCLGTFLKVPLTKVTLVEDYGMAFLATILLLQM